MDLPSFTSIRRLRPRRSPPLPSQTSSNTTLSRPRKPSAIPRTTTRNHHTLKTVTILSTLSFLTALPLLLLVEVGNTHNNPILGTIYFLRLDFSHIVPRSVPNAVLINSIARTLGLHDFYQAGLWNFCEGYEGSGITSCGVPRTGYWFNPVEILLEELLAGATIALPTTVVSALSLVRTASHWMAALFLTSTILTFLSVPLALVPLSTHYHASRLLRTLPPLVITATALVTTIAAVIATTMFVIFRNVFANVSVDLSIDAQLGTKMFAFMWVAVGCELLGMVLQWGMCCCSCCGCCGGRKRDRVKKGHGIDGEDGEKDPVLEKKSGRRRRIQSGGEKA